MELANDALTIQDYKQKVIVILYIKHVLMTVRYAQKIKSYRRRTEPVYDFNRLVYQY